RGGGGRLAAHRARSARPGHCPAAAAQAVDEADHRAASEQPDRVRGRAREVRGRRAGGRLLHLVERGPHRAGVRGGHRQASVEGAAARGLPVRLVRRCGSDRPARFGRDVMLAGLFMGVLVAATPVTLDEVRSRSRENLSSLAAALEAERAALGVTQARSGLLPGVSASAGAGLQYNGPREEYYTAPDGSVAPLRIEESNYGFYRLNLNVRQLIYDGAVWARLSEAGASA